MITKEQLQQQQLDEWKRNWKTGWNILGGVAFADPCNVISPRYWDEFCDVFFRGQGKPFLPPTADVVPVYVPGSD